MPGAVAVPRKAIRIAAQYQHVVPSAEAAVLGRHRHAVIQPHQNERRYENSGGAHRNATPSRRRQLQYRERRQDGAEVERRPEHARAQVIRERHAEEVAEVIFVELHFPRRRTQHRQPDPQRRAYRQRRAERHHHLEPHGAVPAIGSSQPRIVEDHRADAARDRHRGERPNHESDHRRYRGQPQPQLLARSFSLRECQMRRDHCGQKRNFGHERETEECETGIADKQSRRRERLPSRARRT